MRSEFLSLVHRTIVLVSYESFSKFHIHNAKEAGKNGGAAIFRCFYQVFQIVLRLKSIGKIRPKIDEILDFRARS